MVNDNTLQQLERTADDGPFFEQDALRQELEQRNPYRRETAQRAMRMLMILAEVRAEAKGTNVYVEWKSIFDTRTICEDMASEHVMRREMSVGACMKLQRLAACRERDRSVPAPAMDLRLRAMTVDAHVRESMREFNRIVGEPATPLH